MGSKRRGAAGSFGPNRVRRASASAPLRPSGVLSRSASSASSAARSRTH